MKNKIIQLNFDGKPFTLCNECFKYYTKIWSEKGIYYRELGHTDMKCEQHKEIYKDDTTKLNELRSYACNLDGKAYTTREKWEKIMKKINNLNN